MARLLAPIFPLQIFKACGDAKCLEMDKAIWDSSYLFSFDTRIVMFLLWPIIDLLKLYSESPQLMSELLLSTDISYSNPLSTIFWSYLGANDIFRGEDGSAKYLLIRTEFFKGSISLENQGWERAYAAEGLFFGSFWMS